MTGDEANYYQYGINILKRQPQKDVVNGLPIYNSQMPILAINALPRAIQQLSTPSLKHNATQTSRDVALSRFFSVIAAMILALYVWRWATEMYGRTAGIFSLLLYLLCPNIMAHSQFAGTDVYSFLFCTATCYHAWKYAVTNKVKQLLLLALFLGIGQISKQSLLLLYPVVMVFLLTRLYVMKMTAGKLIRSFTKEFLIIGLASLLIINMGFVFYQTGKPLKEYHFISAKFVSLQERLSFLDEIPIPLPEPYVAGFDYVAFNMETPPGNITRSSYGTGYFLGKPITGERIWYYYSVCFLYKLPVPFLVLFFTALVFYWKRPEKKEFVKKEIYLLLPAVFIFILFSCCNAMYLGIKNILMVLPLLFIFCGSLPAGYFLTQKRIFLPVAGVLLVWQLFSVASYFPHFIPYTNEFVYNKKDAYKIFGDANLFFQEGWIMAREHVQRYPEIQLEPPNPVHGKVMVSLANYLDFWHEGKMQWLKDLHLEPAGHFHSQFLIFDVP